MSSAPTPSPGQNPNPNPNPPLAPEPFTTQLQVRPPSAWPSLLIIALLFGAMVVAFLYLTGKIALKPDPNSPEGQTLAMKEMAAKNAEFAQSADNATNKVEWDSAQEKLLAAQRVHKRLLEGQAKLEAELKRLAEGSEGKRIAARETWLDQFIAVQDRQRLTDDELATPLRAITTLLPVCQQAIKEKLVVPCDARFRKQVDDVHGLLAQALQDVDADVSSLAVIVAASQTATPTTRTLMAAVAERKDARRSESLAKLSAARQRQRQEDEDAAREQQLAAERQVLEANRAKEKSEQDLKVLDAKRAAERASAELRQAEEERNRERLRRERLAKFEAALPGVRASLSPFVSSGRMHLVAGKGWREGDPGPLSLLAMKSYGALNDDEDSWRILLLLSTGQKRENDRPLGAFPNTPYNTEREIRRVQTFLQDYGDLLVDRGMLLQ